jgi:hypothetical protein
MRPVLYEPHSSVNVLVVDWEFRSAAMEPEYPPDRSTLAELGKKLSGCYARWKMADFRAPRGEISKHRVPLRIRQWCSVLPPEPIEYPGLGEFLADVVAIEVVVVTLVPRRPEIHERFFRGLNRRVNDQLQTITSQSLYRIASAPHVGADITP